MRLKSLDTIQGKIHRYSRVSHSVVKTGGNIGVPSVRGLGWQGQTDLVWRSVQNLVEIGPAVRS